MMVTSSWQLDPTASAAGSSRWGAGSADGLSGLYASVIGDEETPCKLPLLISHDLEERFLRDGWPVGRVYGSESDLAAGYGVGRDVMREAARILEARDFVRMRRGPRGGLTVAGPRREHLQEMTCAYAYLTDISPAEVIEAWSVLHASAARLTSSAATARPPGSGLSAAGGPQSTTARVREFAGELIEQSGNSVLAMMSGILACLLPPACDEFRAEWPDAIARDITRDLSDSGAAGAAERVRALMSTVETDNLSAAIRAGKPVTARMPRPRVGDMVPALNVVQQIMATLTPAEWSQGRPIGSEDELRARYYADRSVVRQAIRMMEDAGTAISMPGRGHGLMTRRPGWGPLSRELCAFLMSRSQPQDDAEAALDALMIEMTGLAATKAEPTDSGLICSLFESLRPPHKSAPISCVQPIERLQYSLARNALLSLFMDGIKACISWQMSEELLAPSWIIEVYSNATYDVLSAIDRHDPEEAMRRQVMKVQILKRCRQLALRPIQADF